MCGDGVHQLICFTADRSVEETEFCRRTVSNRTDGKGVSQKTEVTEDVTPLAEYEEKMP